MTARFLAEDVDTWVLARAKPPRTPGVHVSGVVGAMLRKLQPSKYRRWATDEPPSTDKKALWLIGELWEDVLADALGRRLGHDASEQPIARLELGLDGIYGSPDQLLWRPADQRLIVEESKATFMNAEKALGPLAPLIDDLDGGVTTRHNPATLLEHDDFRSWIWQAKTYAAMALHGAYAAWQPNWVDDDPSSLHLILIRAGEPCDGSSSFLGAIAAPPIIRIRALFLRGDYKSRLCIPVAWEFEPTAEELTTWWATVTAFVRDFPDLIPREEETPHV